MMSEPGTINAATIGNAADEGSAGTTTVVGRNSGRPTSVIRRPSPSGATDHLGAEMSEHLLGMVARRFGLDNRGCAPRVEAGEKHGRFDLGRGDGSAIFDRRGIASALEHDGTAPALRLRENLRSHQLERIEDAPHRPLAERRVAVEGRGDPVAADDPHHQPRAGAGVAEIERFTRRQNRAEPGPANPPLTGPEPLDRRAERLAGLSGPEHVVAFEQPLNARFPAGQEA